ncbi:hypothetical protein SASPL_115363 [Salvia splendens]|uniref:Kynurenine formamidase n=1 Tax=Salvia splendens TaxID=180675 RepID=A0A8X8Y7E4_SALSN|nr:hypothetical protein SASPL_115363 [Salvia splendens]
MKNGSDYNFSELKLPLHAGTHVDAPGHFYDNYFDQGSCVACRCSQRQEYYWYAKVAFMVDSNISQVMKSLHIPKGVKRVLFRTLNTDSLLILMWLRTFFVYRLSISKLLTDAIFIAFKIFQLGNCPRVFRRLMYKKEFDSSFVGFTKDGAQWLVDNTDVKLVGTDYLSVGAFDYATAAHLVFLKSKEIILVEGLKLDDVQAGIYSVHCLPLRLVGSEGSPIRCILM